MFNKLKDFTCKHSTDHHDHNDGQNHQLNHGRIHHDHHTLTPDHLGSKHEKEQPGALVANAE